MAPAKPAAAFDRRRVGVVPSTHDELRKLQALQRVTDVALGYLPLEELLRELLERIADILGTDTAAFLLLDEADGSLLATAAKGIEEEVEQGVRIPVGRGISMMRALMETVDVTQDEDGTRVVLRRTLGRQAP